MQTDYVIMVGKQGLFDLKDLAIEDEFRDLVSRQQALNVWVSTCILWLVLQDDSSLHSDESCHVEEERVEVNLNCCCSPVVSYFLPAISHSQTPEWIGL